MSMFKQSADEGGTLSAETIIGPSVKVEGDLQAVGNVIIEGIVQGTISTDKNITIGSNAEITADIQAESAVIAGTVKGKINVSGDLTLKTTAKINGDVRTGTISIENGAVINGQLNMGSAPVSKETFSKKADTKSDE